MTVVLLQFKEMFTLVVDHSLVCEDVYEYKRHALS